MQIIGHRGAKGLAQENTIISLQEALACKVDGIEVDVRRTKDGHLVLHHDATLPEQESVRIAEHTLAELRKLIPALTTLDEAITVINRQVQLDIELKVIEAVPELLSLLQRYIQQGWQPTDFLVSSFHPEALRQFHQAMPQVPVMILETYWGWRAIKHARQLNSKLIGMPQRNLWWFFIRAMHRRGWQLYTYTLNDSAKAKRWQKWGLHAVITDYPDRFKTVKQRMR